MTIVQCRTSARIFAPMTTRPLATIAGSAALAGLLLLTACTKQTSESTSPEAAASPSAPDAARAEIASEVNWARAALTRNPRLEVVATDANAGVITVRSKDSGEITAVKLNEVAAVPISMLTAQTATTGPATSADAAPASTAEQTASRSEDPTPATAPATTPTTPAAGAAQNPNYTIERADGQVKVSGPGVSIVSTGAAALSATAASTSQRSVEPIICEGRRMLHFDNRSIYVEGDAITARGGCELYITNSRVSASGTAVMIRDATVHIANSTIEGSAASFDADGSAKVYVRSSTFQGVPRRAEGAVVQDQGGNQWR